MNNNSTNTTASSSLTREQRVYQKLAASPLYQAYKSAFTDATGLNLALLPADDEYQGRFAGSENKSTTTLSAGS